MYYRLSCVILLLRKKIIGILCWNVTIFFFYYYWYEKKMKKQRSIKQEKHFKNIYRNFVLKCLYHFIYLSVWKENEKNKDQLNKKITLKSPKNSKTYLQFSQRCYSYDVSTSATAWHLISWHESPRRHIMSMVSYFFLRCQPRVTDGGISSKGDFATWDGDGGRIHCFRGSCDLASDRSH